MLRDKEAVSVLFDELASRFADREGGYTRIVRLAEVRLGDAGAQALIEFVGERDRIKSKKRSAPVVEDEPAESSAPESEQASDESADDTDSPAAESDSAEEAGDGGDSAAGEEEGTKEAE